MEMTCVNGRRSGSHNIRLPLCGAFFTGIWLLLMIFYTYIYVLIIMLHKMMRVPSGVPNETSEGLHTNNHPFHHWRFLLLGKDFEKKPGNRHSSSSPIFPLLPIHFILSMMMIMMMMMIPSKIVVRVCSLDDRVNERSH
jgi:hypothetical protein